MENTEGQIPATAVNDAGNNTIGNPGNFGVEQVESALRTSLFDDTAEAASTEAENDVEAPEVESEGVQEEESVHSESQEESTAETETDEFNDESDEGADRGLPRGVKKRIDKLVAKRREAEAEVERMKAELERLEQEAKKPARAQEIRNNPFAKLNEPEQVSQEIERAKQIRRWCEMNPDGAVVKNADGTETEYSAEQVRNIKVKAMDALEEHLPAQLSYINNFRAVEQVASKEYPWWKDKSSKERQIAEAFLQHFPEITRFPDYKMVLGDYIRGVKAREMSSKSSGASPKIPSQPKTSNMPVSQSQGRPNPDSMTRFRSSGGKEDLSDIIASRFL